MNYIKTAILLAGLTALFMALGYAFGGSGGMLIALVMALAMNGWSYWNSDKMVLSMHNAREVDIHAAPELVGMVHTLAQRAGLPAPKVYIIDEAQPNAFATGRNPENAAVAATTGLINNLSREELAGVMAHELAHIKNHDTLIMTITASIAGALSMLLNMQMFAGMFGGHRENNSPLGGIGMLIVSLLAPLAAMIVQMMISRTREYAADRAGAQICGEPLWLASALQKIASGAAHTTNETAEAAPATAHMFIINPLSGERMDNLFSTHPNTENRVAALIAMSKERGIEKNAGSTFHQAPAPSPHPWGKRPSGPWG